MFSEITNTNTVYRGSPKAGLPALLLCLEPLAKVDRSVPILWRVAPLAPC